MLTEPTHETRLPKDAHIAMSEKLSNGKHRVVVFARDAECGALMVNDIAEAETIAECVETLGLKDDVWILAEHELPGSYYLQPDAISVTEALEAALSLHRDTSEWSHEEPTLEAIEQRHKEAIKQIQNAAERIADLAKIRATLIRREREKQPSSWYALL